MKTSETNQQKGPDAPQASENTEVEEDANVEMAGGESNGGDTAGGVASAFRGSGKVLRSPVLNQAAASSQQIGVIGEETPKSSLLNFAGSTPQDGVLLGRTALQEVRRRVNELFDFIKDKNNVHTRIKQMVNGVKAAMNAAERENNSLVVTRNSLKLRAERAEETLNAKLEEEALREKEPKTPPGPSSKRDRETPGEEEDAKKQKQGNGDSPDPAKEPEPTPGKEKEWEKVKKKKRKKKGKQNEDTQKPKFRRERNKGEALVVEVKEGVSYADLLRKVRTDPELKELGENVVKTRRTQTGAMLLELKKDPAVKSSAFKSLVEKAVGYESKVRALSPETTIECRNLDEITTEEELEDALIVLLDDRTTPMAIRLRKAYGGTQIASIRLSTPSASKLLETGKVKVGWSVCPLRPVPRVTQQMTRCFRCMGFGHQARNCDGPDRTNSCRRCGREGHMARDCKNQPKCVLCKEGDGNSHATGGFNCPVYKKLASGKK